MVTFLRRELSGAVGAASYTSASTKAGAAGREPPGGVLPSWWYTSPEWTSPMPKKRSTGPRRNPITARLSHDGLSVRADGERSERLLVGALVVVGGLFTYLALRK